MELNVVAFVTSNVEDSVVASVTSNVEDSVVASVTPRVELNVVAFVTSNVELNVVSKPMFNDPSIIADPLVEISPFNDKSFVIMTS